MNSSKKLSTSSFLIVFFTIFLSVSFISLLWMQEIHSSYNDKIEEIKTKLMKQKKMLIKQKVEDAVRFIKYTVNSKSFKNREDAYRYIFDTLRLKRYGKDKNGYIFIDSVDGVVLMHPIKKELEGKNLINFKDKTGKYLKRELIKAAKNPKNHYTKYIWYKPSTKKDEKKIAYTLYIPELNWIVGSGVYLDDIEKEIANIKRKMNKDLKNHLVKIFVIFFFILIFAFFILYMQKKKIEKNFRYFSRFLESIQKTSKEIDIDALEYEEFKELGKIANDMLRRRIVIQKELNIKHKALNETIENFKNIIDLTMEAIIFIDNRTVVDVNKAGLKMFGYDSKDEVIGKNVVKFIPAKEINKIESSLKKEYAPPQELLMKKKDGTIFQTLNSGRYIYLDGKKIRMSTILDISALKAKEEALAANRAKSEFLANMSHEIRTPLNAMFGFIRILQEKELDKETREYLDIIEKSGTNLLAIINDILDFSKIEAGKISIEKIEFNPKEEIEVLHTLFNSKASEKNILLNITCKGLHYNIISDPTRLKQVVGNLLSNAVKFTDKNKNVELIVEYNEDKETLYVEVKDEGIGIPKDKIDHIFESFSQADSSTARKYGGTGLGLTISYRLIKLLEGELKVESEVGKGSRFYFEIPAKKTSKIKEINKNIKVDKKKKFDFHLLVVEDNKTNQMFMKVILKKMGITFDIANDGVEAIEMFKKGSYDAVLMDENMPNMNGIKATKKILEYEKENNLKHTPIIALTANALKGDRERFLEAGMDEYLTKPLNKDRLIEVLERVCNAKRV